MKFIETILPSLRAWQLFCLSPFALTEKRAMAQNCTQYQYILHRLYRCGKCCACAWIRLHSFLSRLEKSCGDSLWWFGHNDVGPSFGHFCCSWVLEKATHSNWVPGENIGSRLNIGISTQHRFAIRCESPWNKLEIIRVAGGILFDDNLFYCVATQQ